MNFTLHPGAAEDLAQAARFYRREGGRALAARFLDEFERVAALLHSNPAIGTPTDEQRRWFPLHGIPYAVIYWPQLQGIHILVVRHQHRSPEHGDSRR